MIEVSLVPRPSHPSVWVRRPCNEAKLKCTCSLVPRQFPPPVFDHALAVCKYSDGEGMAGWSHHVFGRHGTHGGKAVPNKGS